MTEEARQIQRVAFLGFLSNLGLAATKAFYAVSSEPAAFLTWPVSRMRTRSSPPCVATRYTLTLIALLFSQSPWMLQ